MLRDRPLTLVSRRKEWLDFCQAVGSGPPLCIRAGRSINHINPRPQGTELILVARWISLPSHSRKDYAVVNPFLQLIRFVSSIDDLVTHPHKLALYFALPVLHYLSFLMVIGMIPPRQCPEIEPMEAAWFSASHQSIYAGPE